MIVYLLKSIVCLLVLLLAHRLLLQREAMHRFNRFFLLLSVVASFLIPAYTIEVAETLDEADLVEVPTQLVAEGNYYEPITETQVDEAVAVATIEEVQTQFNWEYLLFGLYGLISLIFLYRFVRNIKILVNKIQRNIKINYRGQTLVLLKEESLPFSFFKYIFVTESDLEDGKFTDAVFAHECTHIREKHSWDILFIEALLVPLWFHLGLHWAKASIKLNHEFIADQVALRSTPLEKYESQLLAMMLSEQKYGLASSLNFSLTKKRFEMMKRKSVSSKSWIKIVALFPVLGVLVYFFSERVAAKADRVNATSEVYVNASKSISEELNFDLTLELKPNGMISSEGEDYNLDKVKELILERKAEKTDLMINLITDTEMSMGVLGDFQAVLRDLDIRRIHYLSTEESKSESNGVQDSEMDTYFRNASFFVENEEGDLIAKSYKELSEFEKSFLMPNPSNPPIPPSKKIPTSEEFESWKNSKNFALWIDGENVPNSQLDDINNSDIALYSNSFVHLNARSDRFPQEYQIHMYSHENYDKLYGPKSGFGNPLTKEDKFYIYPAAKRVNFGKPWVKKEKEPVSQMINPFASYDSYVTGMNDYKANLDEGAHFIKKSEDDQNRLMSQFLDLSGKYFRLSEKEKRQSGKPKHPFAPYLKLTENGKVVYKMWENLTESEKLQFPTPNSIAGRSQKLLAYDRELNAYELNRNNGEHYVNKSGWKQHLSMGQYQQVHKQYALLPVEEKQQTAAPTHPYSPYVRISNNGLDIFKLANDLTEEERMNMGC